MMKELQCEGKVVIGWLREFARHWHNATLERIPCGTSCRADENMNVPANYEPAFSIHKPMHVAVHLNSHGQSIASPVP